MTRNRAIDMIETERERQNELHPEDYRSFFKLLCVLVEEVGEVATAIEEDDEENLKSEITQVGAVAIRALECLF